MKTRSGNNADIDKHNLNTGNHGRRKATYQ